jgi:hypothetical protein
MANNKNNLELSRYEIVIINQVLNNVLKLTPEKEKNNPFNVYEQVEKIANKLNEYLKK